MKNDPVQNDPYMDAIRKVAKGARILREAVCGDDEATIGEERAAPIQSLNVAYEIWCRTEYQKMQQQSTVPQTIFGIPVRVMQSEEALLAKQSSEGKNHDQP